ncbi:Uncharacterized conserved protein [Escherichia coli]|nr:Uncharacterized conserved protein [Escherichia coli]
MENFANKLKIHTEHVAKMGVFCTTEETTKQALIMPLLDILGLLRMIQEKSKLSIVLTSPG